MARVPSESDPVVALAHMLASCGLRRVVDEHRAITRSGETFEHDLDPDAARYLARFGDLREVGATPVTLAELGAIYGLSRERIRQLEAHALAKLKTELVRRGIGPDDVRDLAAMRDGRA